jgi:hypothetical protein
MLRLRLIIDPNLYAIDAGPPRTRVVLFLLPYTRSGRMP